jgi:AraC family transcriptional regulator
VLQRWNQAIALVEEQLRGEVDVAEMARVTLTSEYHFRRVFSALAGMPVSEYVRRRRLTVATAEVVEGRRSVLDVAVRYGYGSGDAFTRAFKAMHGITPAQARRPGAVLRTQPRLTFHLTIEGATTVHHRIERTPALRIVGRRTRIPLRYHGDNPAMVAFHESLPAGYAERLLALADVPELPDLLFVSSGFEEGRADGSEFDYRVGVATRRAPGDLPADLDVLEVVPTQWAVFAAEGSTAEELQQHLQQLWVEAFGAWLPANPYEVVPGPEVLRLSASHEDGSGRGELWLPVQRTASTTPAVPEPDAVRSRQ